MLHGAVTTIYESTVQADETAHETNKRTIAVLFVLERPVEGFAIAVLA